MASEAVKKYQRLADQAREKATYAIQYGNAARAKEWLETAEAAERAARVALDSDEAEHVIGLMERRDSDE